MRVLLVKSVKEQVDAIIDAHGDNINLIELDHVEYINFLEELPFAAKTILTAHNLGRKYRDIAIRLTSDIVK